MASITKTKNGSYRVKIRKKGFPAISKNFTRKSHAQRWATKIESEIDRGVYLPSQEAESILINELIAIYIKEEVPKKKSANHYKGYMKLLSYHFGHLSLNELNFIHIKSFRDNALSTKKGDTVRKQLGVLSAIINYAQKELNIYLPRGNPIQQVTLPEKGKGRNRRIDTNEETLLLEAAQKYGGLIQYIIPFALETALRRGEIAKLEWQDINFDNKTAEIRDTKNDEDRVIPLTNKACNILKMLKGHKQTGEIFNIRADAITKAFSRCCKRSNIEDLRFHDLRHEATSRFFEMGLNIMEVSSITDMRL